MDVVKSLVFSTIFTLSCAVEVSFPPWFKFGASTSAYQIEGAWNVSDKGESIWDRFVHSDPTIVRDLSNGDMTCDSYHQWKRDVQMAAEVGLEFYRFSLSWTRLLPTGYSNKISEDGKNYYNNLIDGLLEKGIQPVITLYHWDLPQNLQELGGWTNPLIANWFRSYATVAFSLFADRVKTWITINEPMAMCDLAYSTGILAPGIVDTNIARFLCNKHVLLAHAKAWRVYDEQFKPLYHGKVSISTAMLWYEPSTRRDNTLAKLVRDFIGGRYTNAIYSKEGGWPSSIVKIMNDFSFKEGYEVSRMPEFSKDEIELIRGTYDFFALNYYTCRLVRRAKTSEKVDTYFMQGIPELRAIIEVEPGAPKAVDDFQVFCPKGLRELLAWIKEQYGNVEILITENGFTSTTDDLKDTARSNYIKDHLEQVLLSIKLDRVNVTGYTYWSLMDNFEWTEGFYSKFGLYNVDFESPLRTRTPRMSAYYYSNIIRTHALRLNATSAQYFLNN